MAQDDQPIPDSDQLSLGELRHRVRSLDEGELRTVIEHEREHGDRFPCSNYSGHGSTNSPTAPSPRRATPGR